MSDRDAAQLLPTSAHVYERTLARACDPTAELGPAVDALHGLKINNPPASYLPYLVWEYGLGMLSPYLPNLYDLVDEGVDWLRLRGTPAASHQALGWIGYATELEYAPPRRLWWNQVQIGLNRVRDDEADLVRIEGLVDLSIPFRSDLWRGFHGYDVRAAEAGWSRAGECLASDDSGARIAGGTAKWSFGRSYEHVHDVTLEDLAALGIPDPWALTLDGEALTLGGEALRFVPGGGAAGWTDGPWLDISWFSDEVWAASVTTLQATGAGPAWAVFMDAGGEVLFCRRCRIRRSVVPAATGPYSLAGSRYQPAVGTDLYLEALTGLGDGYGMTAASVGFVLSAQPGASHKPGADYLPSGGLGPAGPIIAEFPVSIEFGRTVRERVACLLRF